MTTYKWGAVSYILWGAMHAIMGARILFLNLFRSTHAVVAALYQDSAAFPAPDRASPVLSAIMSQNGWNLLWIGVFAVVVGERANWRNSRAGYWANLAIVSLADIGFIAAVLIPGYIALWVGIWGPLLWVLATILFTLGIRTSAAQRA